MTGKNGVARYDLGATCFVDKDGKVHAHKTGTATVTCTAKDGVSVSTFVKLTPEELAKYKARGVGKGK